MEICPKCGLPLEACVCEQIVKGSQKISVKVDKKRYGKVVTIISGFGNGINIKQITKELKNKLACGGTYNRDTIELQGDHRKKIKEILVGLGFDKNSIED
ncbi:MAG: stress response translation initiation inhibitor YciH [Candidatus Pacearchaeota archaeon]